MQALEQSIRRYSLALSANRCPCTEHAQDTRKIDVEWNLYPQFVECSRKDAMGMKVRNQTLILTHSIYIHPTGCGSESDYWAK